MQWEWAKSLAVAYSAGLLAAISPCVIVLVPLLMFRFVPVASAESGVKKPPARLMPFVCGFQLSYLIFGYLLSALLTSSIQNGFKLGLGGLFVCVSILSMLNRMDPLHLPLFNNTFFMGVSFALLLSFNPCTVPFLAMIISLNTGGAVAALIAFGNGLLTPAIICVYVGRSCMRSLAKRSGWLMSKVGGMMSAMLGAAGVYLVVSVEIFNSASDVIVATLFFSFSSFLVMQSLDLVHMDKVASSLFSSLFSSSPSPSPSSPSNDNESIGNGNGHSNGHGNGHSNGSSSGSKNKKTPAMCPVEALKRKHGMRGRRLLMCLALFSVLFTLSCRPQFHSGALFRHNIQVHTLHAQMALDLRGGGGGGTHNTNNNHDDHHHHEKSIGVSTSNVHDGHVHDDILKGNVDVDVDVDVHTQQDNTAVNLKKAERAKRMLHMAGGGEGGGGGGGRERVSRRLLALKERKGGGGGEEKRAGGGGGGKVEEEVDYGDHDEREGGGGGGGGDHHDHEAHTQCIDIHKYGSCGVCVMCSRMYMISIILLIAGAFAATNSPSSSSWRSWWFLKGGRSTGKTIEVPVE